MDSENIRFTQEHEWVSLKDSTAVIGISKFAVEELGEIVYVELPQEKTQINQGEECGTVESVKTVSSIYAPISGTITENNKELEKTPNLVSDSPLDEGWLIKLTNIDTKEFNDLMTLTEYNQYLKTLE